MVIQPHIFFERERDFLVFWEAGGCGWGWLLGGWFPDGACGCGCGCLVTAGLGNRLVGMWVFGISLSGFWREGYLQDGQSKGNEKRRKETEGRKVFNSWSLGKFLIVI